MGPFTVHHPTTEYTLDTSEDPRDIAPAAATFRTRQPEQDSMEGGAKLVTPVRMNKKSYDFDDPYDFRPRPIEEADPKDSAVPEPVPSSISETTDGSSENPEPSASAEKGNQTETEQPKTKDSSPEPSSSKKTSPGKPAQPAEI